MKTKLITMGWCLATSLVLVIVLFVMSEDITHRPGSFLRIFPPHPVISADTVDIKYNSYYFSGATEHTVYLGNYTAPLHLLVLNPITSDTQQINLSAKNIDKQKFWSIKLKVDSPYFYLCDGAIPRIYRGQVNKWSADRFSFDSVYFVDIEPLTEKSFAIKSLSSQSFENELARLTTDTPHVTIKHDILERQIDGRFCVDGMMHFDKKLGHLVYVYFYRNQYIVMDKNLNLIYRSNTIDTTSRAQIKVASINSENTKTMAAPPLMVNKHSGIYQNYLFVNSNRLARNESKDIFDKAAVIDVYDLKDGGYKFSFYLFDYKKNKLRQFKVMGNKLVAIFDQYVVTYDLVPKYFPQDTNAMSR